MKNKELIYNTALKEVIKLKLDSYHTVFLSNMVLRRIRHPEEKIDIIASKTMKKMKKVYTKKDVIEVSTKKCLDQLEMALNDSKSVPNEWLSGQTVSHVVKKLALIVEEDLAAEAEE